MDPKSNQIGGFLFKRLLAHFNIQFSLIKAFGVTIRPPRAPNIKEVIWYPPNHKWNECNCDGAFNHNTNASGYGGIFRNNRGDFLLGFAENL